VRQNLSLEAKAAIDRLLAALARHFRTDIREAPPELLGSIDEALDAAAADERHAGSRSALPGLVGVRRGLFPDAPAYRPILPAALEPEIAA